MRTLIAPTEESIIVARTELSAAAAKGTAAVLALVNDDRVTDGCAACVGRRGSETAELVRLGVSEAGEVTADLRLDHAAGEAVEVLRFDSRRFYGAATEAGAYSLLAAAAISVDDPQGTRYEYTGTACAWFKATYYDSVNGDETAVADAAAAEGDQSGRYAAIEAVRKRAGMDRNQYVQDDRFEAARKRAEGEIDASVSARYSLPFTEVPAVVTEICELLAAGAVMADEFPGSGEESPGLKLQKTARAMLKEIRNGSILLVGAAKAELARASVGLPSFYPNATSRVSTTDPTEQRMPRNKDY